MISAGNSSRTGYRPTPDVEVRLKPHASKEVKLSLPEIPEDGNEHYLNLYAYTREATELIPAGFEVAREQLKIGTGDFFAVQPKAEDS